MLDHQRDGIGNVFAGVKYQEKVSPLQRNLYLLESRRFPDRKVERARDCSIKLIIARNPVEIDEAGFIRDCPG